MCRVGYRRILSTAEVDKLRAVDRVCVSLFLLLLLLLFCSRPSLLLLLPLLR